MIYDLAIIGGGPAGYSAAFEAIALGWNIILFEKEELGGTCLNKGCVPTKYLAHTSELMQQLHLEQYGISCNSPKIDFDVTQIKKREVMRSLRAGLEKQLLNENITIIRQQAFPIDAGHILCDKKIYETKNLLLATGAVIKPPFVKGALTSDDILELTEIPTSMVIIGGGVVAVEFASIFKGLGSDVTIAIRGERILRKWDRELAVSMTQKFKKMGITIIKNCKAEEWKQEDTQLVLSAIGRKANIVGLEKLNLKIGTAGGIVVDADGRTNIPGIYAAGDVIEGSTQLAHIGMEQGKRAVQSMTGKKPQKRGAVINCIYTVPEVASVGITEEDAKQAGISVVCAKQNMQSNARTLIVSQEREFIKIIADKKSHKILGAQLMCERAGDIVSELALAINQELTVEELKASTRPHPSFCETITTVTELLMVKLNEV